MRVRGSNAGVHRVAYELLVGPIAPTLTLDHLCRNRRCCNPAHLEPVTIAENVRRGVGITAQNARKEVCSLGHPFDMTCRRRGRTYRGCRTCERRRNRKRWANHARHPLPALRAAREAAGLSQRRLAALLGVASPVVNRWETGNQQLPEPRRQQIAAIIGPWTGD